MCIIHNVTAVPNLLSYSESIALEVFKKTPFEKAFRRPTSTVMRNNSLVHDYWVFISHLLPAYVMDGAIMLTGKKPL